MRKVKGKDFKGFHLSPDVAEAVRQVAFERRISQSVLVEEALREYLDLPAKEEKTS